MRRRGFTIVELLVVIGIVIVLMGVLIVAVRAATRTSQNANSRTLMSSIKQALTRFEGDAGFLPPVLGHPSPSELDADDHDLRKLFDPMGEDLTWNGGSDEVYPQYLQSNGTGLPNDDYGVNVQTWFSVTTLAEYLVGYGHHEQDGWGRTPLDTYTDETPLIGIRSPDTDGVWGAATYDGNGNGRLGDLGDRMAYPGRDGMVASNVDRGTRYGPYLELKDERVLAAVDWVNDELVVLFPGDGNYDPALPKAICDYWGNPIRYYRRAYAPGTLNAPYHPPPGPNDDHQHTPTLGDVFVLRPYELGAGGAVDNIAFPDADGDTTTTPGLNSARFALLSAGPDKTVNPDLRVDGPGNVRGTDYANEDNIVELGQ